MENKSFFQNFLSAVMLTVLGLFVIKFFNISYPLTVVNTTQSSELAVVGEGKVEVTPDTAYIDAGVTVDRAPSVEEAQKKINEINNKIIKALREIGIEKADIKTSNYSINPSYKYENNENRIDGYNGNVTVEIRVKDPQLASKVIGVVTAAGANQIQGSRFVVGKPELYREEARNAAIKNAKDQAQKIAKDLGIKLGKITNIVESSPGQSIGQVYAKFADGVGGGPNIEQGSQTLTSVVTLYFEKK